MPFDVKLNGPICGIAAHAVQGGGEATMIVREFISSENGNDFIERLEGMGGVFLGMLPEGTHAHPSFIDNMLVMIRKDHSATIYINECALEVKSIPKRDLKAGWINMLDDVAAVSKVGIKDIDIPEDVGFWLLFSFGWRKGLYWDFGPLNDDLGNRSYDLEDMLAWCFDRLRVQSYWSLTDADWESVIRAEWFPFVALKYEKLKSLLDFIRAGFDLAQITEEINSDFINELDAKLDAWRGNPYFKNHMPFLEVAAKHHWDADYLSSTTILYPRVEGIMKSYHAAVDTSGRSGQKAISTSATMNLNHTPNALRTLLTPKFLKFLEDVYFGTTDKTNAEPEDICRNSVSHGTADAEKHNMKSSLLGLLIVDQLFYYLAPHQTMKIETAGNE